VPERQTDSTSSAAAAAAAAAAVAGDNRMKHIYVILAFKNHNCPVLQVESCDELLIIFFNVHRFPTPPELHHRSIPAQTDRGCLWGVGWAIGVRENSLRVRVGGVDVYEDVVYALVSEKEGERLQEEGAKGGGRGQSFF